MGYTHYWKAAEDFSINEKAVKALTKLCRKGKAEGVIEKDGFPRFVSGDSSCSYVSFNGVGEDSYETFRVVSSFKGEDFCKTARRPYDKYVVAALIILESFCQGFSWSSDGNEEDFQEAKELLASLKILNFLDE